MHGIHDLGGVQNFGRVPHTVNEYEDGPFQTAEYHEDWEPLAYGLLFACADADQFSVDQLRHSIERMEARDYMSSSYFERILVGTATLMVENGVLTQEELENLAGGPFPLARPAESKGRPANPDLQTFEVGDRVRVATPQVPGHIRVPGYCFGKEGVVQHRTLHEWRFPDAIGHGRDDGGSEPTYHVRFDASDIFGEETDAEAIVVDLFGGYLERVA